MLTFDTRSIPALLLAARQLAIANDVDPDTLEDVVRKAARIAHETTMQHLRDVASNDRRAR